MCKKWKVSYNLLILFKKSFSFHLYGQKKKKNFFSLSKNLIKSNQIKQSTLLL